MTRNHDEAGGGTRRRNSVAPNPWRRGRRRPMATNGADSHPESQTPGALRMITGLFRDAGHAQRAYQSLSRRGYRDDEFIVVLRQSGSSALRVITAGRLAERIENAKRNGEENAKRNGEPVSGKGSGIARTLEALGLSDETARRYATGIESGNILVGVIPRTPEDATALAAEWADKGSLNRGGGGST